ncbi:MAG: threonine synthase [Candidatus Binatia bacterium]|nr:threonine synthase [Candidatus Binatia bacterium]
MKHRCWFQCIDPGCEEKYEIFEVIYRCRKCSELLEVVHDEARLARTGPESWKSLFDGRIRSNKWPYGSGVWCRKEMVLPQLSDEHTVSMYEGGTNLFWAERFGREIGLPDLWVKQCGNSHTGSFKDLGMTVLVSVVKEMQNQGQDIPAVACASTGDTSAALAAYCAAAEIPAVVLLPRNKVSLAQLVQPISNGAIVLSLDTDFDGCMATVQELTQRENIYLANSMNSLRIEGQKTVGMEIVQQFDWQVPDTIIIPGGNLGNVSALGKGFLLMEKLGMIDRQPRIVVAQAEHANPLYLAYKNGFKEFQAVTAKPTLASAIQIGNPVSYKKAVRILEQFDGIVEQASEQELADASAHADRTGMFNCPHTGVALAVLLKLLKRGEIKKDERVVVVSTAHGLKFADQKALYHQNAIAGVTGTHSNEPIELPNDVELVRETLRRVIGEQQDHPSAGAER